MNNPQANTTQQEQSGLAALQTYFQLMTMNGGAYVFHTASQFGVLKALVNGPKTATEIAGAIGIQERPTTLVLRALQGLSLVTMTEAQYTLTPAAQFLAGSYEALGQEYWNHLPTLMKTGQPLKRMETQADGEAEYRRQAQALEWMMMPSARAAVQMLRIGTERKGLKILDLGAGSGVWSLEILKADPTSQVTIVDWPGVLPVALHFANEKAVTSRVQTIAGDYHKVDFGTGYDLVIMGNVTHLEDEAQLTSLLHRAHACLKPKGEVAIFDVMSKDPRGTLSAALYELGLALRTSAGEVHSEETLTSALTSCGFTAAPMAQLPVPPFMMGLLMGFRKGNA